MSGERADQNDDADATAPWSTTAAAALSAPAIDAISSRTRIRLANASDAVDHACPPPAETASAGSQTSSRKRAAPIPSAIAAYWTPFITLSAFQVTEPAFEPASSSSTVAAGAGPSPTVNTNPLEMGCESAEITR